MQKKKAIEHTQLLVLSLLAGEDMYGYQMIVELARRSDRTFEMKEGTLYPVLHGLEREGLVEAYQQEAPTGPPPGAGPEDGGGGLEDLFRSCQRGASFQPGAESGLSL